MHASTSIRSCARWKKREVWSYGNGKPEPLQWGPHDSSRPFGTELILNEGLLPRGLFKIEIEIRAGSELEICLNDAFQSAFGRRATNL